MLLSLRLVQRVPLTVKWWTGPDVQAVSKPFFSQRSSKDLVFGQLDLKGDFRISVIGTWQKIT